MRQFIKKIIHAAVIQINQKSRYKPEIVSKTNAFHKDALMNDFVGVLKSINYQPKHILDIGANTGTWTRHLIPLFPNTRFSMFEPQHWLKEYSQKMLDQNPNISFYPVGLGKEKGSFNFTIVERDDSCNFYITEQEAREKGYQQIKVEVITVNDFIKSNQIAIPDWIKIDAEGLDIEVLEGASDCFGITEIFMVEVGIINKQFNNSILKMMNYMDQKGYTLFDITDINKPFNPKVLWLMELVFVKKNGILDSKNWLND